MKQLLITVTNTSRRLPEPKPLPVVTEQEAREFFRGWWHGIAIGAATGLCAGVLAAGVFA